MKKYLLISLFVVSIFSCAVEQKKDSEDKYYDEFYSVLNEITKDNFSDVSLIINETKPVYRNYYGNHPTPKSSIEFPPPSPPPGIVSYTRNTFMLLEERKLLDSLDADYMYQSIDSTMTILIDSTRIELRLIPESKIIEIYRSIEGNLMDRHNEIARIYGTKCFLEISTPVFNSNFTKVIFTIEYNCGKILEEPDDIYICEKKNGKWTRIIGEELFETR